MKLFLIFLFTSFVLGTIWQEASVQQRSWLMTGIVIMLAAIYFFFDSFI